MSIQVTHLTKLYGQQKAVNDISFRVAKGEIVGFLGPNGAGKSTTMKILTGILPPDEGQCLVAGFDIEESPLEIKRRTGYLAEHNPLYHEMFVHEYLAFMAGMYDLQGRQKKDRISEMINMCGLTVEQNKKIGMLSKGYRQRVGLAQALIHDPEVLILDEPTTGLDPNQLIEIRNLIKMVSANKTVLFSTHILQEVKAICDRVVVINKGSIVADDRLEDILGSSGVLIVEFAHEVTDDVLLQVEGVKRVSRLLNNRFSLEIQKGHDVRASLVSFASRNNLSLIELKQEENSLESIFSQLTQVESA